MNRISLGAISLAVSSLLLAVFPLVRPFGERLTIPPAPEGAQILMSTAWVVAHTLGAVGFILLPLGLFGLYSFLREGPVERRVLQGLMLSWLGVGLFLPIFGTEAFSMRAIGNATINQKIAAADLPVLVNSIRMGPQVGFLVLSLLLLAVGGVLIGVAVWKSCTLPKWSGVLLALGLAFFFPLSPQPVRVVDGLLIGVGGIWIALSILELKKGIMA